MRRVELVSGLPHRPARGLTDKISPVADDAAARSALGGRAGAALRVAEEPQGRRAAPGDGGARSERASASRCRCCWCVAFAVGWGEWATRLGEAFSPVAVVPLAVAARIDAWIDPPRLHAAGAGLPVAPHRPEAADAEPVSVPEGSKLTVRVVSREPPR